MSTVLVNEIRAGFYLDSVALMRLSRVVGALPGVVEAAMMTGTPANRAIMSDAGLLDAAGAAAAARGNDLVIAVRARDDEAAQAAVVEARRLLDAPRQQVSAGGYRPRSIAAAVQDLPGANLALVSVPGDFAAAEARRALRHGLHVMLFSDNVPLDEELALKREARERGLLMMGPDCGTAIINGVPLAFANATPRGDVGIVGASGTGVQEVSTLLARAGHGVSQAIGVGGRDLNEAIGGIMTLMAIDLLDADSATRHLVLISKPPHPEVAARVLERIGRCSKPCTVCFIGGEPATLPANATFDATLRDAATSAAGGTAVGKDFDPAAVAAPLRRPGQRIEGLFSGGTLCAEAQIVLRARGCTVVSNAPVPGVGTPPERAARARLLDLGADEYTRGRPHPMIDPTVRDEALREALAHAGTGVVLLDLVIGHGAHADPAGHLAEVLGQWSKGGPVMVASVTGTDEDPQVRSRQVERLEDAGVLVAPSNAQAAELAAALIAERD